MSEEGATETEEVLTQTQQFNEKAGAMNANPEVAVGKESGAVLEGRLERLAILSRVTNWVETKFNDVVPENKRVGVKTVLGLIPFFNATCDTLKGEALQQEAFLHGVRAVREKDWSTLKTEFGNWFNGAIKETVGKVEFLADIATSGEASPVKTTIIEGAQNLNKGLKGESVVRNSGGFIESISKQIAEKNPQLGNVLSNVGGWLTSSSERHPEATKMLGSWIDQHTEPIRNALSNFDKPNLNQSAA